MSNVSEKGDRTWMVLASIASVQIGASYAHRLMEDIGPSATVLLRQGIAAAVLLAATRPSLARSRAEWRTIATFGLILGTLNVTFYSAVERLPLGIAVSIELLGPLGLAAALARKLSHLVWVGVALVGVLVLCQGDRSLNPVGVLLAFLAAGGWALYILVSRKAGKESSGIDALALAMAFAALLVAPFGLQQGSALLRPHTIRIGVIVAVLAALLPFSLEIVALRQVPARVFGVLMSLSPVAAALSGFVLLGQRLTLLQGAAMLSIVAASFATARGERSERQSQPDDRHHPDPQSQPGSPSSAIGLTARTQDTLSIATPHPASASPMNCHQRKR